MPVSKTGAGQGQVREKQYIAMQENKHIHPGHLF